MGEEVGGGWGDDDEVGLAGELDVAHLDLVLQVPQAGVDGRLAQRREGHGGDEVGGGLGQDAADLVAALAQGPDKFGGFVGGDAAADDEEDAGHREVFLLAGGDAPPSRFARHLPCKGRIKKVFTGSPSSR